MRVLRVSNKLEVTEKYRSCMYVPSDVTWLSSTIDDKIFSADTVQAGGYRYSTLIPKRFLLLLPFFLGQMEQVFPLSLFVVSFYRSGTTEKLFILPPVTTSKHY